MDIGILPSAADKLWAYVNAADGEISGLGIVEVVNKDLLITDIRILKQKSTAAHTDIDSEALSEFMVETVGNGTFNQLRLWWHSHAAMSTFWSAEDTDTIGKFGGDWMLSIVVNKKKDIKGQLNINVPIPLVVEDIDLVLYSAKPSKEFYDEIEKEVKEKVSSSVVGNCVSYGNYHNYHGATEHWDTKSGKWVSDDKTEVDTKYLTGKPDTKDKLWRDSIGYARGETGEMIVYNTDGMSSTQCWIEEHNGWVYRIMTAAERRAIIKDIQEDIEMQESLGMSYGCS